MSFAKGHQKLGGRKKGTPNKKTALKVDMILSELDINPIKELISIACSNESSISQKIDCYKEIARYTYPRLKSVERTVSEDILIPTVIELVGVRTKKQEQ